MGIQKDRYEKVKHIHEEYLKRIKPKLEKREFWEKVIELEVSHSYKQVITMLKQKLPKIVWKMKL